MIIVFANPYLRCRLCGTAVRGMGGLGLDGAATSSPCGHEASVLSICPTWGPVDGCLCLEHLGRRTHELHPPLP